MEGRIISINVSAKKGTAKTSVSEATLQEGYGIIGDAHASGAWHRQVSLLDAESIEKFNARPDNRKHPCMNVSGNFGNKRNAVDIFDIRPGDFAENITTKGLILSELPIGAKLKIGETAILEITQIGKECHTSCEIRKKVGDCIMPRKGIFVRVIKGGEIKIGDLIDVCPFFVS